jgi:indolepyruvate ferredoxin oxidoreductase alpha subunit
LPAIEPADLDEAREMAKRAFEISEELRMPVILRSVTRLGHMTGDMTLGEMGAKQEAPYFDSSRQWTPFPCLEPERRLKGKLRRAGEVLERYQFDEYQGRGTESIGVVGAGFAFNYVQEAVDTLGLRDAVALLKISTVNPLPTGIIQRLLSHVNQVLVVEDVTPFLEEAIRAQAQGTDRRIQIHGRGSGALPEVGETILDDVISALADVARRESPGRAVPRDVFPGKPRAESSAAVQRLIPRRQIGFCAGCPHRATYHALSKALENVGVEDPIVVGDIGCYALGFYPPFSILQTMTSMGASMGTSDALAQLNPSRKVIAFIGDSTFYHAGMPGLLQIAHQQRPVLIVAMDNSVTASTGQQPHPGTWQLADERTVIPIEDIARAFRIPHVRVVHSLQIKRLIKELEEALALDIPAMIVSRQACALEAGQRWKKRTVVAKVDAAECDGCLVCVEEYGCPAFVAAENGRGKIAVDPFLCNGCGSCRVVCPRGAIYMDRVER